MTVAAIMPPNTVVRSIGARGAGAGSSDQRNDAEDESERRHCNGAEPLQQARARRIQHARALLPFRFGELHDRDCVSGREPGQKHETDLRVDVVGMRADQQRNKGTERGHHHRQNDRPGTLQLSYCPTRKR